MENNKKVVFISGPITGVENYWEAFEKVEEMLENLGYIALTPSRLPHGMSNAQYTRICMSMIDSADAVVFLNDWEDSEGARLEWDYCGYINKLRVELRGDTTDEIISPKIVIQSWLQHDLEEVLK